MANRNPNLNGNPSAPTDIYSPVNSVFSDVKRSILGDVGKDVRGDIGGDVGGDIGGSVGGTIHGDVAVDVKGKIGGENWKEEFFLGGMEGYEAGFAEGFNEGICYALSLLYEKSQNK